MESSPFASIDILEAVAQQLDSNVDRRRLRLASHTAAQAVDRCGCRSLTISPRNVPKLASAKGLWERFPNVRHLRLTFPAPLHDERQLYMAEEEVQAWWKVLEADLPRLRACTHLELCPQPYHATFTHHNSLLSSSTPWERLLGNFGHGEQHGGLPLRIWELLTRHCPHSVSQLTLPYAAWRHPPTLHTHPPPYSNGACTRAPQHTQLPQALPTALASSSAAAVPSSSLAVALAPAPSVSELQHCADACGADPTLLSASEQQNHNKSCQPALPGTKSMHENEGENREALCQSEDGGAGDREHKRSNKAHEEDSSLCRNGSAHSSSSRSSRRSSDSSSLSDGGGSAPHKPGISVKLPEGVRAAAAQIAAASAGGGLNSAAAADGDDADAGGARVGSEHVHEAGGSRRSESDSSSPANDHSNGSNSTSSRGGDEASAGAAAAAAATAAAADAGADAEALAVAAAAAEEEEETAAASHSDMYEGLHAGEAAVHTPAAQAACKQSLSNPLAELLDARPHIASVSLTGSTCCWTKSELATIAGLRGITRLCGLSVITLNITPLTVLAPSLQHLEVCLPDSPHPDEADPTSAVFHAPMHTVSELTQLRHLDLWGYSGNTSHLLLQLASLPHLEHLSLFGLASAHSARIDDLAMHTLALLPSLTSFGADQIRITEQDVDGAPCLPHLTRLEVGQRLVSFQRLHKVFPCIETVKLQWLWEQAMRKLAGCLSIKTLHLSHLSYCVDWRLLRTLQHLQSLTLDACASMRLLAEVLSTCVDLPRLRSLTLSYWGIEMLERRQQQQRQQHAHSRQVQQQQHPCREEEELIGPVDAAVMQLRKLTQLKRLELAHVPAALVVNGSTAPPNLEELHLSGVHLSHRGLLLLVLGHKETDQPQPDPRENNAAAAASTPSTHGSSLYEPFKLQARTTSEDQPQLHFDSEESCLTDATVRPAPPEQLADLPGLCAEMSGMCVSSADGQDAGKSHSERSASTPTRHMLQQNLSGQPLRRLAALTRLEIGAMLPEHGPDPTCAASGCDTAFTGLAAPVGEDTIMEIERSCPAIDVLWRP